MTAPPVVSVIMANYRGAAHLARAMASVLAQTERRLELILADDASDDDSVAIARRFAEQDPRVRVIASTRNAGPAATRNLALDMAEGTWIAVVDSDDLIHPERLARLIGAAENAGVDMVADDLVYFGDVPEPVGRTLLQPMALAAPMVLGPAPYLRSNDGGSALPRFGYLKPVIRRAVLAELRYDPDLRIGEDHDLVLRLMINGARLLLVPDPLYAYRRHGASISHRLSVETVEAMLQALHALPPLPDPETRAAAVAVDRQLRRALRYERLVADIKARRWQSALPRLVDPVMILYLADSLRDRRRRRRAAADAGPYQSADFSDLRAPLPVMPGPGRPWEKPPAEAAALIAAGAARGHALPGDAPPWAVWLARAVGGDRSAH
ncbi:MULTISPECIES: glycosyltransferase family 2 protein [Paracoccus]|uniref:glycosyltransferase family 2 protein n=1 Tax=Paracoccus TaxID=265 RepID=UPI0023F33290|nr:MULTISPECIES: glycosyltransferase family 2 protein [Paracoccus]